MVDDSTKNQDRKKNDTYRACATMILKNGWCLFPNRERRIRTTILTCFVWYRGLESNRIEDLPEQPDTDIQFWPPRKFDGASANIYPTNYQKWYSAIKAVGMRGDVIRLISQHHQHYFKESLATSFNLAYVPSGIVQTVSPHCISTLYKNSQNVVEGMHANPSSDLYSIVY